MICYLRIIGIILLVSVKIKGSQTFTDDAGRKVFVSNKPVRIISLAPGITEILYELVPEDRIVGVSSFSDFPKEAQKKTKVGSYVNPNFERIIALKPDLVIATAGGLSKEIGKKFEDLNIPLYVIFPKTINDIARLYLDLGEILQAKEKGSLISKNLLQKIENHKENSKKLKKLKVFYVIEVEPLIGASKNTFIDDLLIMSNFINVLENNNKRYPNVALEYLIKTDPDLIIVSVKNKKEVEKLSLNLSFLRAVKNSQVYQVDPDIFNRPSSKIVKAFEKVLEIQHKAFKKIKVDN